MYLNDCWVADLKQKQEITYHTHPELELICFVSGSGQVYLDEKVYKVRRNSFAVIPANIPHNQIHSSDVKTICMTLNESGLDDLYGVWHDHSGCVRFTCERLWMEYSVPGIASETLIKGMVYELIAFCRRAAAPRTSSSSELVNTGMKIIFNLDGYISVGELASRLGISSDYLRHLFKRHIGKSPIQAIIERKIEKAKDLLSTEDISIKSIAHQIGCDDEYYFSRMFKKVTGIPPTKYRKKVLKK